MASNFASSLARSIAVVSLLAAAGCSGGGGGGDDSGLTLARSSVSFSTCQDCSPPASQAVGVTVTAADAFYVAAGYPQGTTPPTWLSLSLTGSGTQGNLVLTITRTDLAPQTYTATARVVIARADQSVIAFKDVAVSYTVEPSVVLGGNLAFTHVLGGPTQTKPLSVGGSSGVAFTVSADRPWVTLGSTSGTTPASVSVSFDPAGLVAGSYSATISVTGGGRTVPFPVTLDVSDPALAVTSPSLAFSGVNGAPIAGQTVDVSLTNGAAVDFTATASDGWIVLGQTTGTTPATVTIGVDPSVGPLASGAHAGTVTFATSSGAPLSATVDVAATLTMATLSVPASLVLGGADGRDLSAQPLEVSTDTGPNAYPFTAVASDAWMSLSASSGDASGAPATLQVTPVPDGLTGGTRTGTIDFTATVNGDSLVASVPVTFNLESHRLLASAIGVAFTKTPGPSLLARTLRVTDNLGLSAPWTATSSESWLTVTPSGTGDGDLVLAADPAGLAADQLYLAAVTIASTDASVEGTETIRVGLWVGSAAPASQTVAGTFAAPATDPVRPYVYVHTGGSSVSVFNVHTGALLGTFPAVAGSLGGIAVSGDGSTLYAIDKATWKLVPVDLDTWTAGAAVSLANTQTPYPRVAWTRTGGQPVIVVTDGTVRDAADLHVLWSTGYGNSYSPRVAASLDGSVFCAPLCKSLSWSALGGGTLTVGARSGALGDRDGALSPDGSVEYEPVISGYAPVPSYSWVGYDTTTGQLAIVLLSLQAYPNNVEVGWDGRVFAGRSSGLSYEPDVWVFTPAGGEIGNLRVATSYNHSLADGALVVSGDGLRIVGVTSDYSTTELRLVNAP